MLNQLVLLLLKRAFPLLQLALNHALPHASVMLPFQDGVRLVLLELVKVLSQLLLFKVLFALEGCLHHLVVFLCLLLNLLILVLPSLTLEPPLLSDLLLDLQCLLLLNPVYLLDPLPAESLCEFYLRAG